MDVYASERTKRMAARVSEWVQDNETLAPYQQKSCSSLTHSVLLQRYVWEKMALSASGPYLYGVNVRTLRI